MGVRTLWKARKPPFSMLFLQLGVRVTQYNGLKIALGGIFQLESASYFIQRPTLPLWTNFHAGIRFCDTTL